MSTEPARQRPLCVGAGEALWDLLPTGPALGGAPVNVCAHANQLGMRSEVVSAVGDDAPGRKLIGRLDELGVGHAGLQVQRDLPTGTVDVALDASGVPCFTIRSPVAWDAIEPTPEAIRMAREADVMVFGSLAQRDPRSRSAIQALVKATRPDCIRILDINLRPPFISGDVIRESLMLADVLKLNESELPVLTDMLSLGEDESSRLRGIRERFNLKWVVYTKGPKGSRMVSDQEDLGCSPCPTRVVDTVGAGDAFTAVVATGLVRGWDGSRIQSLANRVAAFVCSQAGATPLLPTDLAGN